MLDRWKLTFFVSLKIMMFPFPWKSFKNIFFSFFLYPTLFVGFYNLSFNFHNYNALWVIRTNVVLCFLSSFSIFFGFLFVYSKLNTTIKNWGTAQSVCSLCVLGWRVTFSLFSNIFHSSPYLISNLFQRIFIFQFISRGKSFGRHQQPLVPLCRHWVLRCKCCKCGRIWLRPLGHLHGSLSFGTYLFTVR